MMPNLLLPQDKMPCYLFCLFIQACAVGFDDILIPVKGILFVAFQRTGAVIVAVYIDKAIPFFSTVP